MISNITRRTAYLVLNNAKTRDELEQVFDCTSEEDIKNLPFLQGARVFNNLDGLPDNEMSQATPIIRYTDRTIYAERNKTAILDDEYNWWKRPVTEADVDREGFGFKMGDDNELLDFFDGIELTIEGQPLTRCACYIANSNIDNTTSSELFTTGDGINLLHLSSGIGTLRIKSILGETISSLGEFKVKVNNTLYDRLSYYLLIRCSDWPEPSVSPTTYTGNSDLLGIPFGWTNRSIYKCGYNFSANVWVFNTEDECDNFLRTGDYSQAINFNSEQPPVEEGDDNYKKWYIYSDIKRGRYANNLGTYEKNYLNIESDKNISNRPVVGYIVNSENAYNVKLKINNREAINTMQQSFDGGITYNETYVEQFKNPAWGYLKDSSHRKSGGFYFSYNTRTNIPIFGEESDADKYLDYEIDDTSAINDVLADEKKSDIGEDMISSELNDTHINIALSKTLVMQYNALAEIGRTLYDEQTIDEILDGLKLMGETPLNFICDLFALPFNPLPFCASTVNRTIFYGLYSVNMSNIFNEVTHSDNMLIMFNTPITGLYKDFRDLLQNYYLYLPYVGITAIDIQKYIYKTMKCGVQFDVRTGTIKYRLFANNVVVDTFEGSVRVSMPLIGTNNFSATMSKIGAVSNIATETLGIVTGGLTSLEGSKKNNVANFAISSLNNAPSYIESSIENIATLTSASPKHCSGNFSPQTATMDELNAYLIIDAKEIIYPDTIKTTYNIPDHRVGLIGSCRGFMQCTNVKLETSATLEETNEILNLLQGGVII